MVNLANGQARFSQAVADGMAREARGIFHAVEALFLYRGSQLSVAHYCRRRISVIGINTEDVHN